MGYPLVEFFQSKLDSDHMSTAEYLNNVTIR